MSTEDVPLASWKKKKIKLTPGPNKQYSKVADTRLMYKRRLLFCISVMNNWHLKLKTNHLHYHQKRKHTGINITNTYNIYMRKPIKP